MALRTVLLLGLWWAASPAWATRVEADFSSSPMRYVGKLEVTHDTWKSTCTATLVGYDWILSAAHCFRINPSPTEGRVIAMGKFSLQFSNGETVATAAVVAGIVGGNYEKNPYPYSGSDWALARLDKPLGKKFGYLDVGRETPPKDSKVMAGGYSQDRNAKHPGLDTDCAVIEPSSHALTTAKQKGHLVTDFLLTTCDIFVGASGGPIVAPIRVPIFGTHLTVPFQRIVAVNAGVDTSLAKHGALGTATTTFWYYWGLRVLQNHLDQLHGFYDGKLPRTLSEPLRKILELWGRGTAEERFAELERSVPKSREKELVPLLEEARTQRDDYFHSLPREHDLGVTFAERWAPLRVQKVAADSPADRAGLKVGDIVTRVAKETYPSEMELFAALRTAKDTLELEVRRAKKSYPVSMAMRAR